MELKVKVHTGKGEEYYEDIFTMEADDLPTASIMIHTYKDIHIDAIAVAEDYIHIYPVGLPARIDYDKYLNSLWLLGKTDIVNHPKPIDLMNKKESKTVWTNK